MKYSQKVITPDWARSELLKHDASGFNRPRQPQTVAKYARMMREGKWLEETGLTIKYDEEGFLIDGQHRLAAIVMSGIELRMTIVTGCVRASRDVIDTGRNRTLTDKVAMAWQERTGKKIKNLAMTVAAVRQGIAGLNLCTGVPESKVQDFFRLYGETAIKIAAIMMGSSLRPPAAVTAAFLRAALLHYERSIEFAERFARQSWESDHDPIKAIAITIQKAIAWRADKGQETMHGGANAALMYGRAVSGIRAAIEGRELVKVGNTEVDLPWPKSWPHAEEKETSNGA